MYHEIQAEDETHSKKSASTGSSSAIKSRSRVKSMSKHDQFIRLTHFLFAIKSGLGVKSGWRLDILFTLVLLFIVLETDFLLYVLSPAWISWYIFSTLFTTFRPIKSTLYSVFYQNGLGSPAFSMWIHSRESQWLGGWQMRLILRGNL